MIQAESAFRGEYPDLVCLTRLKFWTPDAQNLLLSLRIGPEFAFGGEGRQLSLLLVDLQSNLCEERLRSQINLGAAHRRSRPLIGLGRNQGVTRKPIPEARHVVII